MRKWMSEKACEGVKDARRRTDNWTNISPSARLNVFHQDRTITRLPYATVCWLAVSVDFVTADRWMLGYSFELMTG